MHCLQLALTSGGSNWTQQRSVEAASRGAQERDSSVRANTTVTFTHFTWFYTKSLTLLAKMNRLYLDILRSFLGNFELISL